MSTAVSVPSNGSEKPGTSVSVPVPSFVSSRRLIECTGALLSLAVITSGCVSPLKSATTCIQGDRRRRESRRGEAAGAVVQEHVDAAGVGLVRGDGIEPAVVVHVHQADHGHRSPADPA